MLFDYYNHWAKCPECQDTSKQFTPYFKCGFCGYIDKKDIAYQTNKREKEWQKVAERMIKKLLPNYSLLINYPEISLDKYEVECAGWTTEANGTFTISIPKKAFYLPSKEFTDTTAHEAAHVPTWYEVPPPGWNPDHGPEWYNTYLDFFNKLNGDGEFSDFINQPSSKARFSVNEEIPNPKSYYRLEYGFDPNED